MDRLYRFALTTLVIIVLAIIGVAKARDFAVETLTKQAMEQTIVSDEIKDEAIEQLVALFDEEDQKAVKEIITTHVDDMMDIKKITNIIRNGNVSDIKNFMKSDLSEEEIKTLKNIYRNHKDDILKIVEDVPEITN